MSILVGWAIGVCGRCGQTLRRKRPADTAVCDCHDKCKACGARMARAEPDLSPRTYRGLPHLDPSGSAEASGRTMYTRYYCSACDAYDEGVPVEVELS